jgi:hypothetical protein
MLEVDKLADVCLLLKNKDELIDDSEQAQRFFPNGRGIHVVLKSDKSFTEPIEAADSAYSTIRQICMGGKNVAGSGLVEFDRDYCSALRECTPIKSAFKDKNNNWKPAIRSNPK